MYAITPELNQDQVVFRDHCTRRKRHRWCRFQFLGRNRYFPRVRFRVFSRWFLQGCVPPCGTVTLHDKICLGSCLHALPAADPLMRFGAVPASSLSCQRLDCCSIARWILQSTLSTFRLGMSPRKISQSTPNNFVPVCNQDRSHNSHRILSLSAQTKSLSALTEERPVHCTTSNKLMEISASPHTVDATAQQHRRATRSFQNSEQRGTCSSPQQHPKESKSDDVNRMCFFPTKNRAAFRATQKQKDSAKNI